jgi:anthranilate phosphoribosyltransferase
VLKNLGSEHVLVVHAADGLDEISIASETYIAELKDGKVSEYQVTPEDFGLQRASLDSLQVNSVQESLAIIQDVLAGNESAAKDIVALNSGAAIYAANVTTSLKDGVAMASDLLASGQAKEKFKELIEFSQNS